MQSRSLFAVLAAVAVAVFVLFRGACAESWAADRNAAPSQAEDGRADAAEEDAVRDREEQLTKLVALGPGVHKVKLDEQGRVRSLVIVGQARISTVLGQAKGLQTARTRADLAVRGEFVKWLKEEVIVRRKSEDETVLFLEGNEDTDKQTLRESGKAVERTDESIQSVASGLVRGLTLLHKEVDGHNKVYTLVYGWSAERSSAAEDLAEPKQRARSSTTTSGKTIPSDRVTSDEAGDFLD